MEKLRKTVSPENSQYDIVKYVNMAVERPYMKEILSDLVRAISGTMERLHGEDWWQFEEIRIEGPTNDIPESNVPPITRFTLRVDYATPETAAEEAYGVDTPEDG